MAAGSGGLDRFPVGGAWQELVPWLEQPPAGDMVRLRNNRSMEGSSGLRRLTGQKADPPCGVKFTLLGSGQEEMRAGLSWCGVLPKERKAGKEVAKQSLSDVTHSMTVIITLIAHKEKVSVCVRKNSKRSM